MQLAWEQRPHFCSAGSSGVWLCDLSPARTDDEVVGIVARVLGLSLRDAEAVSPHVQVGHGLSTRGRILVVLDNFEQVLEPGAAVLASWLEMARDAVFVVTSRERLRLVDEQVLALDPLPSAAAAQLFVDRARACRPGWTPDARTLETVAQIASALEGIPLAIELAAARMSVLAPERLLQRLSNRFELLGNVRRGTSDRQATLWGAIEWSWTLLEDWEREALVQCSVFRGGFSLEAAESVAVLSDPSAPSILDVVQSLSDKSLLRTYSPVDLPGELRFGFFESIRDFAEHKLRDAEPAVLSALHDRHADWTVGAALPNSEAVHGHDGLERLRRLTLEVDNLLGAVRHSLAQGRAFDAYRGLLALQPILSTQGPWEVFQRLLDEALELNDTSAPAVVARVLEARGTLLRTRGRPDEALVDLERARVLASQAGKAGVEAGVIWSLGIVHHEQGRMERARELDEQALQMFRQAGDRRGEGRALGSLAILHNEQGRPDDAQIHYEWALALFREVGDHRSEGIFLSNLGDLHREQGRNREARSHYEAALEILRIVGDRRVQGVVLGNLGAVLQEDGDLDTAHDRLSQALALLREVGDRRLEGIFGGYLGGLLLERGEVAMAVAKLQGALQRVQHAGDKRFEAIALMYLAVAEATRERLDASAVAFDASNTLLADLGDRLLLEAHRLHRVHLELARGRKDPEDGDRDAVRNARQQVAEARSVADSSDEIRFACRLLTQALPEGERGGDPSVEEPFLVVDTDGRGFTALGQEHVDMSRRRALRLVLTKLATHRITAPGQALTLDELLEAGWPGERVLPEAGSNRVSRRACSA